MPPRWRRDTSQIDQSGHCMALAAMTSAFSQDSACGIAVLTRQGDAVIAISRGGLNNPIWALSDNRQLLNQMAILRGVRPIHYRDSDPQHHHSQLIDTLRRADQLKGVHSLLISRLDSLEGSGHEDVCRLVPLPVTIPQPERPINAAHSH